MKHEPRTCEHRLCVQAPTRGVWCYYHAQVAAGLIDPMAPGLYAKKVIEGARRRESARFKADIAMLAAAEGA